jgi:hypothetical protein
MLSFSGGCEKIMLVYKRPSEPKPDPLCVNLTVRHENRLIFLLEFHGLNMPVSMAKPHCATGTH